MRRSPWRFFPLAVIAGLGFVIVVNFGMVFAALQTFPGKAGDEDFELSNHYDAVLAREQREAALGWNVSAGTDAVGTPEITLTGKDGSPLHAVLVAGSAERPLGALDKRALVFHETAGGRYIADVRLPMPGQWDLTLSVSQDGRHIEATRRVIVR